MGIPPPDGQPHDPHEARLRGVALPDHRELAPGTLRKLIRAAGIAVEEFRTALG